MRNPLRMRLKEFDRKNSKEGYRMVCKGHVESFVGIFAHELPALNCGQCGKRLTEIKDYSLFFSKFSNALSNIIWLTFIIFTGWVVLNILEGEPPESGEGAGVFMILISLLLGGPAAYLGCTISDVLHKLALKYI